MAYFSVQKIASLSLLFRVHPSAGDALAVW
jgi:hypothetical protein